MLHTFLVDIPRHRITDRDRLAVGPLGTEHLVEGMTLLSTVDHILLLKTLFHRRYGKTARDRRHQPFRTVGGIVHIIVLVKIHLLKAPEIDRIGGTGPTPRKDLRIMGLQPQYRPATAAMAPEQPRAVTAIGTFHCR